MAQKTSNPLLHLHRAEAPYAIEWEVLDAPAPRRFEEREPLQALHAAFEADEL